MSRRRRPAAPGDEGTALISSIAGLLVFLAMLLFAVQTLVGLYTRSVVTDAAHEGARRVAGARADQTGGVASDEARVAAEQEVRRLLGRFGDEVSIDWTASTADTVSLRVRARPPGFLWDALRGPGSALVDRTVTVRVERPR